MTRNAHGDEYLAAILPPLASPSPMPGGAIGDINSDAKGSGARFNSGKAPYDLVPLKVLAHNLHQVDPESNSVLALFALGEFQSTANLESLFDMMHILGLDGWGECAAVFEYGKKKYAAWNWAKGMAWSVPVACMARHLIAMIEGEEVDPESNLAHRGHVFCNVCMLVTFMTTFPEGNDLPPVGRLA